MNKRHYEHTLPNIRGSLSNTYFSTIYTIIFQALKSTFADLLECGEKEIGRKEKNAVSRKYKFPKEVPFFLFRWFSRKNSVVFISFK